MKKNKNIAKEQIKPLITSEEIYYLLEKYCIGKKPLSKLLGWGETTIIRYIDGDIPTGEYAEKLKKILDSPQYYYEILLKNRENLTDIAYKKSKKAVLGIIAQSKIQVVAQCFINLYEGEITSSQLQILLFYAKGIYLAFYDKPLFQDEFRINATNQPYLAIESPKSKQMLCCMEVDLNILQEREREYIYRIQEIFSWYGPKAFYAIFERVKGKLKISRDKENNKVVTDVAIKNFFIRDLTEKEVKRFANVPKYIHTIIREAREEKVKVNHGKGIRTIS